MRNTKYIVALFLSCLVKVQGINLTSAMPFKPEKGVLASVQESPLFFHKCSAIFLTPTALLSTASCLKCSHDCDLYITIYDNDSVNSYPSVMTYPVERVVLHPNQEMDRENNNFGLIELKDPVQNSHVFQLPEFGLKLHDIDATIFKWIFSNELMEFVLHSQDVKVITNQMCSLYLYQFISHQRVCIRSHQTPKLGYFDYGTPIIGHYQGKNVVLGMFVETGATSQATVVAYQAITPHVNWLNSVIFGVGEVSRGDYRSEGKPKSPPTGKEQKKGK